MKHGGYNGFKSYWKLHFSFMKFELGGIFVFSFQISHFYSQILTMVGFRSPPTILK